MQTMNNEEKKSKMNIFKKLAALISYLGPFSLVIFILNIKDDFVRHHLRQGLILFFFEIFFTFIWLVPAIGWIAGLIGWSICNILSLVGIIFSLIGKKLTIPLVNWLGKKLKI